MTTLERASLRATLEPDALAIELQPRPSEAYLARFAPIWHEAEPARRVVVEVEAEEPRRLRLVVKGLRSGWARWELLARRARELEGGAALDEQDRVSEFGESLVALFRAGERRTFHLNVSLYLLPGVEPGVRFFEVAILDDATGETLRTLTGSLLLDHPDSRLLASLPALYGEAMRRLTEEEGQTPFFTRYLLGFEDALKPIRRALDRMDALLGPYSTPSEFLMWLGAWVCLPPEEGWSEMKRRRLIHEAVELFRWRGTRRGLSRYLEIYAGTVPEIDDQPVRGMRLGPQTRLGYPGTSLGDIPPHTFVVTVAVPDPSALDEAILHDIVAYEKPAHTAYTLRVVPRATA